MLISIVVGKGKMTAKIILVDVEEGTRDRIKWYLEDLGYEVVCSNSRHFCGKARGCERPCGDVYFIDNDLPLKSRLESVKEIGQKGCNIQTNNKIIMSGTFSSEEIQEANKLGIKALKKPFSFKMINQLILEHCNSLPQSI